MHFSIKPFVFLVTSLLIAAPAIADSPVPDEEFKDWLDSIKAKLSHSDKAGIIKQFANEKIFACKFYVSAEGKPDKLLLTRSSGDASLDKSAMDLVSTSTSLPICPFNNHRIVILILKNRAIELSQGGYR